MSITDELREWAKKLTHWWYDPVKDEYTYTVGTMPPSIDAIRMDSNIIAIADRIDAEHQKALEQERNKGFTDGYDMGFANADDWFAQHEDAMTEHGWVRRNKEHAISHATVEVTPHIDWSRMADELDEFVEIVRSMALAEEDA